MVIWPDTKFGPVNLWNAPSMSETKQKIETYVVNYTCDACGKGTMKSNGISLMCNPPLYVHVCTACKSEGTLRHLYPRNVYEVV